MNQKSEYLVNLIFRKLKNYKAKEIFLEKKTLNNLLFHFLKRLEFKI